MNAIYEDYLAHHGVKGQKWGIRNFQNYDGTLIHPKGRKKAKEKKVLESESWKNDDPRYLSDDELKRRNARMNMEQQYRNYVSNREPPMDKEIKSALKAILFTTAVTALSEATKAKYATRIAKGVGFIAKWKNALPL